MFVVEAGCSIVVLIKKGVEKKDVTGNRVCRASVRKSKGRAR